MLQKNLDASDRTNRLLHSVRALRAKNEHVASVWIGSKHFAHQCRQSVDRLPEVDRLCRYPDLEVAPKRDHRTPLTADNTVESVAASTPGSTRIRTSQTSISIRPRN